jgi:alanyl-tRNA synthetase
MIEDLRKVAQPSFAKTNFVGFTESTTQAVVKMLFNDKCESVETLTGQGYVIFDQTPFYAMGGGQASDQGTMAFQGKTFPVLDVRKDLIKKYFIHAVDIDCPLQVGDEVTLTIDDEFRTRSSVNHSALHITWMTIIKLVGHYVDEVGSKLNKEKYQLQFAVDDAITPDLCVVAMNIVNNEIVPAKIPAHIFEVTYEEAEAKKYLYDFTKIDGDDLVRMVDFKDIVIEPCGGTHANHTGEIKKAYFLNYDRNAKRILIEYTTNEEYAEKYYAEKYFTPLERIKKLMKTNPDLDFAAEKAELDALGNSVSYIEIKKINKILNDVTLKVNKKRVELQKDKMNTFLNTELVFETYHQFDVIQLNDDLIDNKILLAKASDILKVKKDAKLVFINQTEDETIALLVCDRSNSFNIKDYLADFLATSNFKGGGSPSMVSLKTTDASCVGELLAYLKTK